MNQQQQPTQEQVAQFLLQQQQQQQPTRQSRPLVDPLEVYKQLGSTRTLGSLVKMSLQIHCVREGIPYQFPVRLLLLLFFSFSHHNEG